MEYIGRIVKIENERSGTSAKTGNPWHSLAFVFEYFTPENQIFPDSVVLETMNENIINQLKSEEIFKLMNAKSCVKIAFYHKTRTYENRTYNDIRINKFEFLLDRAGVEKPQVNTPSNTENAAEAKNEGKTETTTDSTQAGGTGIPNPEDDDLPF
jgi:hypothetical protein